MIKSISDKKSIWRNPKLIHDKIFQTIKEELLQFDKEHLHIVTANINNEKLNASPKRSDQNIKHKTINILEKNIRENLWM